MRRSSLTDYKKAQEEIKPIIVLWFKRIYVMAFNIYAWFWLIREIFIYNSTDFENYLVWFLTTSGVYFFILNNNDIYFKIKDKNY